MDYLHPEHEGGRMQDLVLEMYTSRTLLAYLLIYAILLYLKYYV